MTPKLYKAAEVCEQAQLQPFVLRSWEKEFPGIGIQKSPESPRLYRQSDVEQLLRIKQLVFGEGLTLAGARRKIEESAPPTPAARAEEVEEVIEVIGADVHNRIAHVRNGLRSILSLLDGRNDDEYELTPPSIARGKARPIAARKAEASRAKAVSRKASVSRGKTTKRVSRAR
jgi:DNA-binding transcriptional MerR regulator